ncbi:MAG: type I methionyl aminopeptidase [Actinomycetia bacterium]|nr:type I methionyl aminopeptidase [Actinomycetes bacterium]
MPAHDLCRLDRARPTEPRLTASSLDSSQEELEPVRNRSTKLKPNDPCWCGSGQKLKRCHRIEDNRVRPGLISNLRSVPHSIPSPSYADGRAVIRRPENRVKSADVLERMERTGQLAADILIAAGSAVKPGVTTDDIDELVHQMAIDNGSYPSPLMYGGPETPYPKSVCTSVNEVICHGIPDDRLLDEGDIINIDITVWREGVHGDTSATFYAGEVDPASHRLTVETRNCLLAGIGVVIPGQPISEIGRAIEEHAMAHGLGVVRDFVGHGIGEQFHTDLQIAHYYHPGLTTLMERGMTFTIEPMITLGSPRAALWDDGWTAVTADGLRTAQFEHTVQVTDEGAHILTEPTNRAGHPFWELQDLD